MPASWTRTARTPNVQIENMVAKRGYLGRDKTVSLSSLKPPRSAPLRSESLLPFRKTMPLFAPQVSIRGMNAV